MMFGTIGAIREAEGFGVMAANDTLRIIFLLGMRPLQHHGEAIVAW